MIFAAGKVDCGPLDERVGDLADKLVSTMSRRFKGAHEVSVRELKGRVNGGVVGFLGVSQLVAFPHRTDFTARNRTVKRDPIAALPVYELQAAFIEVTQSPMPQLGIGHRIYRLPLSSVSINTEVWLEEVEFFGLSAKSHGDVARLQSEFVGIENLNDTLSRCRFYREKVAPNTGHN